MIFKGNYLAKMSPIFDSSDESCLISSQKKFQGGSIVRKDLWNLTYRTLKLQNCHHVTECIAKNKGEKHFGCLEPLER